MAALVTGRRTHLAVRAALGACAALLVAGPFALAWQLHDGVSERDGAPEVAAQAAPPAPADAPRADADWRALDAELPDRAPPIVLAYHDIAPGERGRYTVSPERFDAHLTALAAAGYQTLTSEELVRYLEGGPVPPRSVLLTFDDGGGGLWRHADPILERHGMRGAAFLITSRVGESRPYYLSWSEVARMHASGRWDFQSHSHDLHTRPDEDDDARTPLAHRLRGADGEVETLAEHRARVRDDLTRSLGAFAEHDLPRPALFSYPFSDAGLLTGSGAEPGGDGAGGDGSGGDGSGGDGGGDGAGSDGVAAAGARAEVAELFAAAFTNTTPAPAPAGRRAAASRLVERLEVYADTTADELLGEVARRTPVSPPTAPLDAPDRWHHQGPGSFPFDEPSDGRSPARGTYQYSSYAPHASADWDGYTVHASLERLLANGGSVGLFAGVDGDAPVELRVSHVRARLVDAATGRTVAERELSPARRHEVVLTVDGGRVTAVVDGAHTLAAPRASGPGSAGGIALSASRPEDGRWPAVPRLRVTPADSD